MNKRDMAELLARDIFKLGDEVGSPCTRIEFKGGEWPNEERRQGGIFKDALEAYILRTLENISED